MKWTVCMALVLSFAVGVVVADLDLDDAQTDWLTMESILDSNKEFLSQSEFEKAPEQFAENWLKQADHFVEEYGNFTDKYGSDREILNEIFGTVTKPDDATRDHYQLINELTSFSVESRSQSILNWADRWGRQKLKGWEGMKDPSPEKYELKLRRAQEALAFFKAAEMLDPDGDYDELIEDAEEAIEETTPQVREAMEAHVWPPHNPEYKGPGNSEDIADAALEFLRKNPNWTKPYYSDVHNPFAARVTGSDWEVYKREPLTQNPTQYSIDVLVAFSGEKEPDIAYVYHMVFYTDEEVGIKKGLPLKYANARQYAQYQMLLENVTEDCDDCGLGFWRLMMSIFLIAGGLAGAAKVVRAKCAPLGGLASTLAAFSLPIGFVLIFLGLSGFCCNLLRFSPLASIFPQLVAVFLGTAFARKSIKTGIWEKFSFLDGTESILGIAALILGILHLLFGGFGLL